MARTLLLTGATGALGVPLLAALLRRVEFDRIAALTRGEPAALFAALRAEDATLDLSRVACFAVTLGTAQTPASLAALPREIDCVVHAAAGTQFRAPLAELTSANVTGTRQLLAWIATLPRVPRVVHLSTTCVAGQRSGEIAEAPLPEETGFVNSYERTKWQAEQFVGLSTLRPEIVRLATVVGDARDGRVRRPGAFHTTLRWLHAGLLPLIPGTDATRLDLVPTELAVEFIGRLLAGAPQPGEIYHVSAGARGVPLGELLALATEKFSAQSAAWRTGQILPPVLASRAAYDEFRVAVAKTRDALFNHVLESVDAFLPELLHPKTFLTPRAETVWGGPLPLPAPRDWLGRVIDYALRSDFARREPALSNS